MFYSVNLIQAYIGDSLVVKQVFLVIMSPLFKQVFTNRALSFIQLMCHNAWWLAVKALISAWKNCSHDAPSDPHLCSLLVYVFMLAILCKSLFSSNTLLE